MKIIPVKSCRDCPCREYDNGAGWHTEPFNICDKFKFELKGDLDKVDEGCRLGQIPEGLWIDFEMAGANQGESKGE
jgi:hypothetical protein